MSPARRSTLAEDHRRPSVAVVGYVGVLLTLSVATIVADRALDLSAPGQLSAWTYPVLTATLVAAEHLRVRFRRGPDSGALTLFESVLAAVIFSSDTWTVVVVAAVAQAIGGLLRRAEPIKTAFNVAQWALAAGVGSLVLGLLSPGEGVSGRSLVDLVIAMACVAVVNDLEFTGVLAISRGVSLRTVLHELGPMVLPAWLGGWLINIMLGLLLTLASVADPVGVLLFPVPLLTLHLAYRGYASARSDRRRLTGAREATALLAEPLEPLEGIEAFLRRVVPAFDARSAAVVLLLDEDEHEVHLLRDADGPVQVRTEPRHAGTVESRLAAHEQPIRVLANGLGPESRAVREAGWHDCLAAPLVDESRRLGTLLVLDQSGLEGSPASDLAVLDSLARETGHVLARGRLLADVMEQRRQLAQIVSSTSDGIFTLTTDGVVLTWNEACERITGLRRADVLGRDDVLETLSARTDSGVLVESAAWAHGRPLAVDVVITAVNGASRRLACSSTATPHVDGRSEVLVVVARDVTADGQFEELQQELGRAVEQQAAQRQVVDHLQRAVAPDPPVLVGTDIAVAYVASDPSSPTGGDLFDWHLLPSGDLHIAVVDVLGHGVVATKDALTVVHALRFAALDGTALEKLVNRADELLCAQESELAATVIVARYSPDSGELRVASGGHPPPLQVLPDGTVHQLAVSGGAIGWPGVGSDAMVSTRLGTGESLIFYTDGLTEAHKDLMLGTAELVRHAGEVAGLGAQELADSLVERALAGAERRDDSLALVVRRTAPARSAWHMSWSMLTDDREAVCDARHELEAWLAGSDVDAAEAVLVAGELLANAAVAGGSSVTLSARRHDRGLVLVCSDDGVGGSHVAGLGYEAPEWDDEHGRGLFLIRLLCEDVQIDSTPSGTSISCELTAAA
ncbi:MAG TPA: SpoIIE family protein phosphatase [Nocardioidaceae bacterium]|nr:SpoIIE family protein phosphatase [Nocardioidaceae bacterium]